MTPERTLVDKVRPIVVQIIKDVQSSIRPVGGRLEVTYRDTAWCDAIAAFAAEYAREQVTQLKERHASDMFNAGTITGGWVKQCDALRAENARLTLAASESARTLQVEIERMKLVLETKGSMHDANLCTHYLEAKRLQAQVTALREAIAAFLNEEYGDIWRDEEWISCKEVILYDYERVLFSFLAALPQDGA